MVDNAGHSSERGVGGRKRTASRSRRLDHLWSDRDVAGRFDEPEWECHGRLQHRFRRNLLGCTVR